jgi:hypothetical protein
MQTGHRETEHDGHPESKRQPMTQGVSDLEHATRVAPEGDGYVAQLSEEWEIWGPNGGYQARSSRTIDILP